VAKKVQLNTEQQYSLELLKSEHNIFLTGAAGTGKSFLLKHYMREIDSDDLPILASTGAAAILVGGRTFHSFFGLGIFEGGIQATIERAVDNKRLTKRLKETHGIVIDEVSMLSGPTLRAAETIARRVRGSGAPWGGMRVIAVGDFAQLPPVNPFSAKKEWAFLDEVWEKSQFMNVQLQEIMRSSGEHFLKVLNQIRDGNVTPDVTKFLNQKAKNLPEDFDGTRLFARKENVESYNFQHLEKLDGDSRAFVTIYSGKEREIENFKKNAPIPDVIHLKEGALVMLRQNDVERQWVNGSLGHIEEMSDDKLTIKLLKGRVVEVEKAEFTLLDADGNAVVSARNFPITLAWAVTIHKAQGSTLDRIWVDIRRLWEPGQAYVALSRVTDPDGLSVEGWDARSIFTDPAVRQFHQSIESR
jgi:ATP-dependent exoDNAse (exonuclease V) alpha subunit